MNHPIITTAQADARLNELRHEAEQYRRAQALSPRNPIGSLLTAIGNHLPVSNRNATQKRLAKTSA